MEFSALAYPIAASAGPSLIARSASLVMNVSLDKALDRQTSAGSCSMKPGITPMTVTTQRA